MIGFSAPKRFDIVRRLGEGGMGVVYEARDLERGERVALKTLRSYSAEALVRFKREFRALQDLHHPNLVALGELISERDAWFFSMELVDGCDFLNYVRGTDLAQRRGDEQAALVTTSIHDHAPVAGSATRLAVAARAGDAPCFDEKRLRGALRQLAAGRSALHQAGLVHRDVKPSNIRVARDGRLVLLDFGLVTTVENDHESTALRTVGTPAYMAPEQALGLTIGPSADWYSVGILLYETLTGDLPFRGNALQILEQKQRGEPEPPSAVRPNVPADLDALCMALLRTDPEARPVTAHILSVLSTGEARISSDMPATYSRTSSAPFVGRARELAVLSDAFDARRGQAMAVLVSGESGVGKTCLVRRFIDELRIADPQAVTLTGRCYERETVPYKAWDGVIDMLAGVLARFMAAEVAALLPTKVGPLVQVFPVLMRVDAIAAMAREPPRVMDAVERRGRAFIALRELLTRLGDRRPLVIVIDDAQWMDDDSRMLLAEVLRSPESPNLLLVMTMREVHAGDTARQKDELEAALPGDVRTIDLSRLSDTEACKLAALLLERAASSAVDAMSIAREAGGHPLFIDALVRYGAIAPPDAARSVRLDDALWSRIASLDDLALRIAIILAVSEAPIPQDVLARAVDASKSELSKRINILRANQLVQTTGTRGTDAVDVYHDRIRAAVLGRIDRDERKALHRVLARALEANGGEAYAEALATHWRAAGDNAHASGYAVIAAGQAERTLAFEHAAALYQLALTLCEHPAEERRLLHAKLGNALANAGRGALAARSLQAAAEGATAAERLDLLNRAAAQLLRAGHIDEGVDAIRSVLEAVGLKMPATQRLAHVLFLFRRFIIFVRGFGFVERDPSQISPKDLARIDVCWSAWHCLVMTDYARGVAFQPLFVVFALRLGEPVRVVRALASEVTHVSSFGGKTWDKSEALMARLMAVAEKTGRPESIGWALFACGYAHYLAGKFRRGLELLERAHQLLRECSGTTYEVATVQRTMLMCLAHLGELKRLCRQRPEYLREAVARGDLYGVVNLRLGYSNIARLVHDDPDEARAEIADSLRRWSKKGFHLEHYFALIARVNTDLYSGEPASALAAMNEQWPAIRRSFLLNVQSVRLMAHWARGRSAVAVLATLGGAPNPELVAIAERAARALDRERWGWSVAITYALKAGIARVRARDPERVRRLLEAAAAAFDGVDMALHAAAVRRRLGDLIGGTEGAALVAAADTWMRGQGIVNATRMTTMLVPGFP
jgi:serine/threonine protein kinase/tetratricopeptide (TPR) repeat protein